MNLNTYQKNAKETAIYPGQGTALGLTYCTLKVNGEAGEIAEHVGKAIRDDGYGTHTQELTLTRYDHLVKELGDVLWYIAIIADELGISLEHIAIANLQKLSARKARGTLGGSGDDR